MVKLQKCVSPFLALKTSHHTLFSTWENIIIFLEYFGDLASQCEKYSLKISGRDVSAVFFLKKNRSKDFKVPLPRYAFLQFLLFLALDVSSWILGGENNMMILEIRYKTRKSFILNYYFHFLVFCQQLDRFDVN